MKAPRHSRVGLLAAMALAAAALGACSDDKKPAAISADSTTTTSTNSTTAFVGVNPAAYAESGDYVNGRHIAQVTAFDQEEVTFDVVQFLTGDAAVKAYQEDHPGEEGPDNDHVIRNQSPQLRTLPIDEEVVIRVNNTGGYEPSEPDKGHEVNVSTFANYVKAGDTQGSYFWLTIKNGRVAAIEEQYIP